MMTLAIRGASVVALLAVAAFVTAGLAAAQPPRGKAAEGNAVRGKALYYEQGCYGCHGYNGETGARDLVGTGSPIIATEAAFVSFLRLRADQAPTVPSTRMPNFPVNALSDAEARDIYAFIRTFKLDQPRPADVPTLKAILDYSRPAKR